MEDAMVWRWEGGREVEGVSGQEPFVSVPGSHSAVARSSSDKHCTQLSLSLGLLRLGGLTFDGTDSLQKNCGLQLHSRTGSGSGDLCGV